MPTDRKVYCSSCGKLMLRQEEKSIWRCDDCDLETEIGTMSREEVQQILGR